MVFTIDHSRMGIISALYNAGEEFNDLKEEVFYYNKSLECWTTKKSDALVEKGEEQ